MNLRYVGLFLIVLCGIYSCDSKADNRQDMEEIETENLEMTSVHCYLFSNGKDSISLHYQREGNQVKGWMNYNFFEKDGSIGEIEGEFEGDTLKLDYDFLAEGTFSEQEVYFLHKDNKLFRGAGDQKMDSDSVLIYSNSKSISFDDPTPLEAMQSCPEDLIQQSDKEFYMEFKTRD